MTFSLRSSPAFGHFPLAALANRGVRISERDRSCLVLIRGRTGLISALDARMREHFAVELPKGPRRVQAGGMTFAGVAPHSWLAITEGSSEALVRSLQLAVGETAVAVDQSHGWGVLRVAGPRARESLARLFPVDLHERVFTPHDIAVTIVGQIDALVWRIENSEDSTPTFEVAVPRSYAGSFWHTLSEIVAP